MEKRNGIYGSRKATTGGGKRSQRQPHQSNLTKHTTKNIPNLSCYAHRTHTGNHLETRGMRFLFGWRKDTLQNKPHKRDLGAPSDEILRAFIHNIIYRAAKRHEYELNRFLIESIPAFRAYLRLMLGCTNATIRESNTVHRVGSRRKVWNFLHPAKTFTEMRLA